MKKVFKIFEWILVVGLILCLGVFAFLKVYFTQARIKSIITTYVSKNLNREVDFKSAELNFCGFSIKNLRLSESSGFKNGEFFSLELLDIRPDLKAFLRKQFKVNSIQCSGVHVNIVQIDSCTYNFSNLFRPVLPGNPTGTSTENSPSNIAFIIAHVALKNSTLSYKNLDNSITANFHDIKLSANSVTDKGFFPFETEFKMRLKSPYLNGDFPSHIKGTIDLAGLNVNKGKAKIENAHVEAGKLLCDFNGKFEGFLAPTAELTLRLQPFSTNDLQAYFPAALPRISIPTVDATSDFSLTTSSVVFRSFYVKSGPAEGAVKGTLSWDPIFDYTLGADLKVISPEMKSDVLAEISTVVPTGFYLPKTNISVKALLKPGEVVLTEAEISGDSFDARATGDFTQVPLAILGVITISTINVHGLSAISPILKPYELKGKVAGKLNVKFSKKLLLSGTIGFKGIGAKLAGNELSYLKGGVTISKKQIKSKGISAKLNGSELKLNLSVNNYLIHPQAVFNLNLATLQLATSTEPVNENSNAPALAKVSTNPTQTKTLPFDLKGVSHIGSISHPLLTSGAASFNYNLKNISTDFNTLSGQAAFSVKGGKFDNLCELAEKYKVAKVALYPMAILSVASKSVKGIKLPDFNTIVFTKLEGEYLFHNGVMEIKKSNLEADLADAAVSGTINLVTQALDMKISVKLKKASGISMSVPLIMKVKGTFDAPSVKMDMKSVMDQPAVKKGVQKLAEEGTKLFNNLFNKKKKK